MEKTTLNAYLQFEGNCREAMKFYQGIFGGKLEMQTFGEVDGSCPEAMKDSIMHASLMGGEADLLANDNPGPEPLGTGNVSLALSGYDKDKLHKMFTELSEGGKIIVPLDKQVWGDVFGAFTDKFDISWMINIGTQRPEKT
jgi:PhnB protein